MLDTFLFPFGAWKRRRAARRLVNDEAMEPSAKIELSAEEYAREFLKPKADIASLHLDRLELALVNKKLNRIWGTYESCVCQMDAPYHIILAYRHEDNKLHGFAVIGLRFGFFRKNLLIKQIQAMGYKRYFRNKEAKEALKTLISSLRWEKMLIRIAEDWARSFGFRRMGVLKARWNDWYEKGYPTEYGRNHQLKMHYDVTAKRMKYKPRLLSRYQWKPISNVTITQ